MNVNFKLISALLAAFGYRYNRAFAFEFITETNAPDSAFVELKFMYRADTKEGAEQVVLYLKPIDGTVIPPFARGQRS